MQLISSLGVPIVIVLLVLTVMGVMVFVSRNYMRCPPNEVLVLYGRKHAFTGEDGRSITRGYRLVTGGAAFRLPLLEEVQRLSLAMQQISVQIVAAPNKDGVLVTVETVANVKLSSEQGKLGAAVEQFLGKGMDEIIKIIHNTLEGIVRQLVGTLTIEEMVRDREKISHRVIEQTGAELAKLGVECTNFVFTKVTDGGGYIESLGRSRAAEVKRDAEIGEAEARREAIVKSSSAKREGEQSRLAAEALIAAAEKDLAAKKAGYDAEVKTEQAKAALAGEIATAERQRELKTKLAETEEAAAEAQAKVAIKQAELAEKQLIAQKIKPAEAERDAMKIRAEGEKQALVIRAEADKQAAIVGAEAAKQAAVTTAEGEATAAKSKAEAAKSDAEAVKSKAGAEKDRLTLEGEGKAEAEAALIQRRGDAEASAIEKKNAALAQMSEGAKLILVLDRLPELIGIGGDALAKSVGPAFQAIGTGLSAIDKLEIVDLGGGGAQGGNPLDRFMMAIPGLVLRVVTEAQKTGVDIGPALKKLGISVPSKDGSSASSSTPPSAS